MSAPALKVNHWHQLRLAFRAGTGSACFMIIYYAFLDFRGKLLGTGLNSTGGQIA